MSEASALQVSEMSVNSIIECATDRVTGSGIEIEPYLPLFKAQGPKARSDRQVSTETMDALKQSGFMRALLPKKWGGLEVTPQQFFAAHMAIAQQDMSTAWVAGVVAVHAYQLAVMSDQAQEEVYSEGPNTLISSSYNPVGGVAQACEGGVMLSGRWGWSSGSEHCTWALLGAVIPGEGYRTFLVPRSQYRIEDTWYVFGLQATGSNDVVIDEPIFVPDYRSHKQMDGFNCIQSQPNPMYKIPWAQWFTRVVSTPGIGALKHAVEVFIEKASASSTDPTKLMTDPDITRRVAESLNDIDESEAILYRNFDRMMDVVMSGGELELNDRIRYRYQASLVIERMCGAIDRLFDVAGGRSVFAGSPIQDIWNDLHCARSHVANNPVSFGRNLGNVSLGAENADVFI